MCLASLSLVAVSSTKVQWLFSLGEQLKCPSLWQNSLESLNQNGDVPVTTILGVVCGVTRELKHISKVKKSPLKAPAGFSL